MSAEWTLLLPYIIPAAAGTLIFIAGIARPGRPDVFFGLGLLACIASAWAALSTVPVDAAGLTLLAQDGYSRFYQVMFAAITALTLLFSWRYTKKRRFAGDEYPAILLFAGLGMMLVAGAAHWLIFFLGLELLSLSLYILIAMRRENNLATEAAIKYFIPGAVATAFLVFGIGLVYAGTGTLSVQQSLAAGAGPGNHALLLLGLGCILVGIGFKISLVPFHLWTPDVYQGAPAPVTGFLATGSKLALFAGLLRLALLTPAETGSAFVLFLWGAAALTMIVGNITALVQESVKRMLAYSSIAHMGYMLMALLAVGQGGAVAILFYSAVYAVSDLGAFGTLGLLSPIKEDRDRLDDFRGLGQTCPGRAALFSLALFSLAGLPLTAGFIGKFVLFRAVFAAGFTSLGLIGIGTAIISMYYYLRVVTVLYMRSESGSPQPQPQKGMAALAACAVVAAIIVWLGLLPSSLLNVLVRFVGL